MPLRNILLVVAALVFGLSVASLRPEESRSTEPTPETASSTLESVATSPSPTPSTPAPSKPEAPVATEAAPTPVLPAAPATTPKPAAIVATSAPQVTVAAPAPAASPAVEHLDSTIGLLRGSIVNIICTSSDTSLRGISGTGVVIDSRGLILTVAHVAQFFLLKDYPHQNGSSCIIKTGSPAKNAYTAELAYISPDWVKGNSTTLVDSNPTGTGEDDFALLSITGSASSSALPASFVSTSLSRETPKKAEAVSVGSYGAEFLSSKQVRTNLYSIIDFGTIKERYTFTTDTVDLIAVDSPAAQEGSSGGGVLNDENELIGLITTSSSQANLASRELHAITPSHIRRSFEEEMDESFDSYVANHSPKELIELFGSKAASLSKILIKAIR